MTLAHLQIGFCHLSVVTTYPAAVPHLPICIPQPPLNLVIPPPPPASRPAVPFSHISPSPATSPQLHSQPQTCPSSLDRGPTCSTPKCVPLFHLNSFSSFCLQLLATVPQPAPTSTAFLLSPLGPILSPGLCVVGIYSRPTPPHPRATQAQLLQTWHHRGAPPFTMLQAT